MYNVNAVKVIIHGHGNQKIIVVKANSSEILYQAPQPSLSGLTIMVIINRKSSLLSLSIVLLSVILLFILMRFLTFFLFLVRIWNVRPYSHTADRQLKVFYGAQHNFEKVIDKIFVQMFVTAFTKI